MKVFMLGWEFPPFISGGLGTACYGLTKAMSDMGVQVVFVLPRPVDSSFATHVRMLTPQHDQGDPAQVQVKEENLKNVKFHTIDSPLQPYGDPGQYQKEVEEVLRKKRSFPTLQAALLQRSESAVEEAIAGAHYAGDMLSEVHRYASAAVRLAIMEDFDVIHAGKAPDHPCPFDRI
jgi:glycogen(starch) synthase